MDRFTATVDSAGRVLLPARVRKRLGLRAGSEVIGQIQDDRVVLSTREAAIARAQDYFGRLRSGNKLWSEELIRERREDAKRESGR